MDFKQIDYTNSLIESRKKKLIKILEEKFYKRYNNQELLDRCYEELKILEERNLLHIFYLLYKYKQKHHYKYHFRGMTNNLFVLYVLGISNINPLPRHYHCNKCKNIYFNKNVCPICNRKLKYDGYNLPYELYIDKTISVDLIEPNNILLAYDFLEEKEEGIKVAKGGFTLDYMPVINELNDDHYIILPEFNVPEDMLFKINKCGELETVEDYHKFMDTYPVIAIKPKELLNYKKKEYRNALRTSLEQELETLLKPKTILDYAKIISISHGTDVWKDNQENMLDIINIKNLISSREDILEYLLSHNIEKSKSIEILNFIRKGKQKKQPDVWNEYINFMKEHNCEDYFINIVSDILYIFGRGQAISECLWAMDKNNYLNSTDKI